MSETIKQIWWQKSVIYQVYPRSFQDSNGDGIGDLPGITGRLDYLKWLGIDAVWLSPIYPSPMADFGYDISDYENISPIFGKMTDFNALLGEVHQLGMKLILDLVPNHTSDRHPWFVESKSSKNNCRRDWYIWHDPKPDGGLPNNWLSVFGGSAWEWDENTGQYYYHGFLKEQPDLNWRNVEVQNAIFDTMRFWLDKGVDGFRVDVLWHLIKDAQFRDNPVNPDYQAEMPEYDQLLPVYSTDQPEMHEIVEKMRSVTDEYNDRVIIGEIYLPVHRLVTYYGSQNNGAHLPFNFMLLVLPWDAKKIAAAIAEYEAALPENGWPNWVLGNHDRPRLTSRLGTDQARVAAMLLLTLRGTPTMYYGDEIGMRDVPVPFDEVQDPQGLNMPDKNLSRDPCRTPMQWNEHENAGFSDAKPWLRIAKAYRRTNVESQKKDPYSMLTLYRKLLALRRCQPALTAGEYRAIYADSQLMAFRRDYPGYPSFAIILNLSHRPCYFKTEAISLKGKVEVSTFPEAEGLPIRETLNLSGDEGVVIRLEPD